MSDMRQNAGRILVAGTALLAVLVVSPVTRAQAADSSPLDDLAAAGDLLRAEKVEGALPTEPGDARWSVAPQYKVPLVSQFAVAPSSAEVMRSEISVRALYNDRELALLLGWADGTRTDDVSAAEAFGDAVAVGFPVEYGKDIPLPYIGMGNEGRPVNIWQWKAAWQRDIDGGFRGVAEAYPDRVPRAGPINYVAGAEAGSPLSQTLRTSPLENLVAEGFGTLTSTPSKSLAGKGTYKDGAWHVVMRRPLKPKGVGARIRTDKGLLPITFAVWDGAAAERNGMKGLTRWRFVAFSDETASANLAAPASGVLAGADQKKGKELLVGLGCPKCHALPGTPAGGQVGPDLSHAGAIHRPEYLLESIIKPNAIIVPAPGYFDPATGLSTMPSFYNMREDEDDPDSKLLVTDDDFRDIASYLWSLR